jgi:hypothetical protein
MTSQGQRFVNRVSDTDWAEVVTPEGERMTVGHLHDVSPGGLSVELPRPLPQGAPVRVRLSKVTRDVLRRFELSGTVVHVESTGPQFVHGIRFVAMTEAERNALTDYLCQVEYQHRVMS